MDTALLRVYEVVDALGVRIEHRELPPDRDGEYNHDERIIRLQNGLATRLHRSTLAHEAAHAVFADTPSRFGPVTAKQERRADEWAALRLIDIDDYRASELRHEGHVEAMAVSLNVTTDLIEACRRMLLRIGDNVYVGSQLGARTWTPSGVVA